MEDGLPATEKRGLHKVLADLGDKVNVLDQVVADMGTCLDPVLKPEDPRCEEKKVTADGGNSKMVQQFIDCLESFAERIRRLKDLRDRLDI